MEHLIELPNCKSILIRKLIARFVRTGEVSDVTGEECRDVLVTYRALCTIRDFSGSDQVVDVDVQDCGSACRFLTAVLAITAGHWRLTGTPVLLRRPIEELLNVLTNMGADIRSMSDGLLISGKPLVAHELTIDCTRSSQFASALLLIAPRIGLRRLHIQPADFRAQGYVQLTQICTDYAVDIPGLSTMHRSVGRLGDWSAAIFWYAWALLHPRDSYVLTNLSMHSAQSDCIVADWFNELGIKSVEVPLGVRIRSVRPRDARPKIYDVAEHPDAVPVMAALAVLLPADFTFLHTRNLRYKESNRTAALVEQLQPFAEQITTEEDSLRVVGKSRHSWPAGPYHFNTRRDHRLAMAFLLFGRDVLLDDSACLCKSYPRALQDIVEKQSPTS